MINHGVCKLNGFQCDIHSITFIINSKIVNNIKFKIDTLVEDGIGFVVTNGNRDLSELELLWSRGDKMASYSPLPGKYNRRHCAPSRTDHGVHSECESRGSDNDKIMDLR